MMILRPLLVVLLAVAARVAATATSAPLFTSGVPPSPELEACLNSDGESGGNTHDPLLERTVYSDFVEGRPTILRFWAGRWSSKKGGGSNAPPLVTVASSLTAGRLDQLEAQCRLWRGPLSAVVYVPVRDQADEENGDRSSSSRRPPPKRLSALSPTSRAQLDAATRAVAALHARAESNPAWCALDVLILFNLVGDDRMAAVLPVNAMRNHALLQARTPLVAMLDVDLLPSALLSDWLLSSKSAKGSADATRELRRAAEERDALFVLPAFETPRLEDAKKAHALAEKAARASTKQELAAMVARKEVWQFALPVFHEGHDDTQYVRWFGVAADAPLTTTSAYSVRGTKDFEPWFLLARGRNPFYDEVFAGYGWNKVTHVAHLAALGFDFRVLPSGWLVHRQHERSTADKSYQQHKRAYEQAAAAAKKSGNGTAASSSSSAAAFETVAGVTHGFRDAVVASLARGEYRPVVGAGLKRCLASLSWWREMRGSRAVAQVLFSGGGGGEGGAGGGGGTSSSSSRGSGVVPPREEAAADPRTCAIGWGPAGEAAMLAATLEAYGGPLPSPGIGGARRRGKR
jgi:glycosyltransferase-like protein LARGE